MQPRPHTENQPATDLPAPTTYLTGHNASGQAVIHSTRPIQWTRYDGDRLNMAVAYTTCFPADLNGDADVAAHDAKVGRGAESMGLVTGGGTVLRYVELAPDYECMMHRTQSVDYGILLEGEVESVLDSGEVTRLRRGDVMVQRATMHAWRNPSSTQWARMIFCLQDCQPVVVAGKRMREDLGRGAQGVPPSGNDK